jgi:rod shape-determining protein MreC
MSWLLSVSLIAIGGFLLSAIGLAGPLRSGVMLLAEPFIAGVDRVTSPAVDVIANAGSYGDILNENRDLRLENERLRSDLAQLREEQARAADVDALLNLQSSRRNDTLVFAAVIGRDPNPQRSVVAISRGSGDGIKEGMSVLGRGGALVGTVESTEQGMSWVRLINDPQSDVNGIIQESRATALASGRPGGGIRMEFLAQGVEVKPGDTVITSGLGGTYPQELVIGRVKSVEGNTLDVYKNAEVEPAVRLSSLENVAVLTSFQPLKLGGR